MKAWRIHQHGGPEVLSWMDVPDPVAAPLQAVVQVEAVGLNHLDLWVRQGVPGHSFHLPMTPGGDISGTVLALGPGAEEYLAQTKTSISIGSPVLLQPGISCGQCEACFKGFDPLCRAYGILGETQDGGCAEQIVVPLSSLIPRPPSLSAKEGAALGISFLTAWTMLTRKAHLQPGELVLIHAGGSGVSVAAIQMAKLLGGTVITTVGSPDKAEKAKAIGADYVIPYKEVSFRTEVKKIATSLGKNGCEVVLDHVGNQTFADSLKCLNWGGRLVTCGATSGPQTELNLNALFFKNISIFGSTMGSKGDYLQLVRLVATGKLKPIVDTVLEWKRLPEAMQQMESRKFFGRTILTIP